MNQGVNSVRNLTFFANSKLTLLNGDSYILHRQRLPIYTYLMIENNIGNFWKSIVGYFSLKQSMHFQDKLRSSKPKCDRTSKPFYCKDNLKKQRHFFKVSPNACDYFFSSVATVFEFKCKCVAFELYFHRDKNRNIESEILSTTKEMWLILWMRVYYTQKQPFLFYARHRDGHNAFECICGNTLKRDIMFWCFVCGSTHACGRRTSMLVHNISHILLVLHNISDSMRILLNSTTKFAFILNFLKTILHTTQSHLNLNVVEEEQKKNSHTFELALKKYSCFANYLPNIVGSALSLFSKSRWMVNLQKRGKMKVYGVVFVAIIVSYGKKCW